MRRCRPPALRSSDRVRSPIIPTIVIATNSNIAPRRGRVILVRGVVLTFPPDLLSAEVRLALDYNSIGQARVRQQELDRIRSNDLDVNIRRRPTRAGRSAACR